MWRFLDSSRSARSAARPRWALSLQRPGGRPRRTPGIGRCVGIPSQRPSDELRVVNQAPGGDGATRSRWLIRPAPRDEVGEVTLVWARPSWHRRLGRAREDPVRARGGEAAVPPGQVAGTLASPNFKCRQLPTLEPGHPEIHHHQAVHRVPRGHCPDRDQRSSRPETWCSPTPATTPSSAGFSSRPARCRTGCRRNRNPCRSSTVSSSAVDDARRWSAHQVRTPPERPRIRLVAALTRSLSRKAGRPTAGRRRSATSLRLVAPDRVLDDPLGLVELFGEFGNQLDGFSGRGAIAEDALEPAEDHPVRFDVLAAHQDP